MKLPFIDFLLMEKLCQRERFLLAEESQIALADIHGINFFFCFFFLQSLNDTLQRMAEQDESYKVTLVLLQGEMDGLKSYVRAVQEENLVLRTQVMKCLQLFIHKAVIDSIVFLLSALHTDCGASLISDDLRSDSCVCCSHVVFETIRPRKGSTRRA